VEDGAEVAITEGAGTIAVELDAEGPFDAVVIPVGNGALAAGMGTWIRHRWPETHIVGVCSDGAPVMRECWLHGLDAARRDARADTIADGIAVRVPVREAVEDLRGVLHEFVMVSDGQLRDALRTMRDVTGAAVESSAVAGIAAIAADRQRFAGLRVATVLTGRNIQE
jgi:threonine dehydratase